MGKLDSHEIMDVLEGLDIDVKQIEKIYEDLEQLGIEITNDIDIEIDSEKPFAFEIFVKAHVFSIFAHLFHDHISSGTTMIQSAQNIERFEFYEAAKVVAEVLCTNHEFGEVEESGIFFAISEIFEEKKQRHIGTYNGK